MENKVEIKVILYCPCCNRNVEETSLWIDEEFKGRIGRLPTNLPCIDCWNREMGFFGNAEEKVKSKTEKMLEEDEKDMHEGEEESEDEEQEETNEEIEEDTDLEEDE